MTLRPGCAPARLLLLMWEMQGKGQHTYQMGTRDGKLRLLALSYIKHELEGGLTLTPVGREAAQVLDAGSR